MALMRIMRSKPVGDVSSWKKDLETTFMVCSPPFGDGPRSLSEKRNGCHRISRVLQVASDEQLRQLELKHLLWPAMGLYCFFRLRFKGNENVVARWIRRRDFLRSRRLYKDLVHSLLPLGSEDEFILSILAYLNEYKLWAREYLPAWLLTQPLMSGATGATVLGRMLDFIQSAVMRYAPEARYMNRVIYKVFDHYFWPPIDEKAAKAITRLLKMYRTGVRLEKEIDFPSDISVLPLRKGMELAIRIISEHIVNSDLMLIVGYMVEWVFDHSMSEEHILEFGSILEHASLVHTTELYRDTFTHELFENLFRLVGSRRNIVSQLGNRILHQLLDRNDNLRQFESPKFFFQNTHFNVVVSRYYSDDKNFIKKHRPQIHQCIIAAIINHSADRSSLENVFCTICLLATEVPCGYTAAAIANLLINIQEVAIHNFNFRPQLQYHLHALVMSVMSLLCWLHNASDFYRYVNKIASRRAAQAPHLNPPLRLFYTFARHHVRWNKAEFFFEDWEVRYCLWMRFKIEKTQTFLKSMGVAGPPSPEMLAVAVASGANPSLKARVRRPTRRQEMRPFLPQRVAEAWEENAESESEADDKQSDDTRREDFAPQQFRHNSSTDAQERRSVTI